MELESIIYGNSSIGYTVMPLKGSGPIIYNEDLDLAKANYSRAANLSYVVASLMKHAKNITSYE